MLEEFKENTTEKQNIFDSYHLEKGGKFGKITHNYVSFEKQNKLLRSVT